MCIGRLAVRAFFIAAAFLAVSIQANAAGFDSTYNVFKGDLNGDGRTDLYIKGTRVIVIPFDDLPIVIGPAVRDFVLQYRGDSSFDLITSLTASQRSAVAQWASADVGLVRP